jgi:hypothetical protein
MKIKIPHLALGLLLLSCEVATAGTPGEAGRDRALSTYGKLPLSFEANTGQTDSSVRFLGRSQGFTLFLTDREAVLSLRGAEQEDAVVRLRLAGGAPRQPVGLDLLSTRSNYLLGDDPSRWHTGVPHYGQVRYSGVYPGIDLVYRGNPRQLEYDFVLAPGADPGRIRLSFQGARSVTLGPSGELVLHTAIGDLVQRAPVLYQEAGFERLPVEGSYVLLRREGEVGFQVGRYDRSKPLVIDPVVLYSTFLGGPGQDRALGVAVDGSGNAYVTGFTDSTSFPGITSTSVQKTLAGERDAFVTKIDAAGSHILYSTFLGGSGDELGQALAVDGTGSAYVAGFTFSSNLPGVTDGSLQPHHALDGVGFLNSDGFVTKLKAAGDGILYSTYLGDDDFDSVNGIAVDSEGNAFLTGSTGSAHFPGVGPGSIQSARSGFSDGFVTEINAKGTKILFSTLLGGDRQDGGRAIALDRTGNVYVTGSTNSIQFLGVTDGSIQHANGGGTFDGFVTQIDVANRRIGYSTFLGGNGEDSGADIAVDDEGNAYVVGSTHSATLPGVTGDSIQPAGGGGSDAFVTKIDADGSKILYSTFLGGTGEDSACCVAVDDQGTASIAGGTTSRTFPGVGPEALQPANAGRSDGFITRIDATGARILDSTFLGGAGSDDFTGMAIDGDANLYLVGGSSSPTFPGVTSSSIQRTNTGGDAIVTRISPLDFLPARAGSCAVLTACQEAGAYPCCTREPICRCRPQLTDDSDCAAGGRSATACSIAVH